MNPNPGQRAEWIHRSNHVGPAKAVGKCGHQHVGGIRRSQSGGRTKLVTMEPHGPGVRFGHRLRIRAPIAPAFAFAPRPIGGATIHDQFVEPANWSDLLRLGERCGCAGNVSVQELDVTARLPVTRLGDRAVDGAAECKVGERAIEFTHGKVRAPPGWFPGALLPLRRRSRRKSFA